MATWPVLPEAILEPAPFEDWRRGVWQQPEPHLIPHNALADAENVEIVDGDLVKRTGRKAAVGPVRDTTGAVVAQPVTLVLQFARRDETLIDLAAAGSVLGRWNPATSSYEQVFSGFAAGQPLDAVVYGDRVLLADRQGAPKAYDGTSVADIAGAPVGGGFVTAWQDRVFLAQGSRIDWSAPLDGLNWTSGGAGFKQVAQDDGRRINGLLGTPFGVLISKRGAGRSKMYRLVGIGPPIADFEVDELLFGPGTADHRTLAEGHGFAYWLSDDAGMQGVYRYGGGGQAELISDPIAPLVARINFAARMAAVFWRDRYVLAVALDQAPWPTHWLVYHPPRAEQVEGAARPPGWEVHRLPDPGAGFGIHAGPELRWGGQAGVVYRAQDTYDDGGAAIDAWAVLRAEHYGAPTRKKRPFWNELVAEGAGALAVEFQVDRDGTWTPVPGSPFALGATPRVYRFPIPATGVQHQLRVRNAALGEWFRVRAYKTRARVVGR